MKLSKRQRVQVVELLRCGYYSAQSFDTANLCRAACHVYGDSNCEIHNLAYAAAEHVYKTNWLPFTECMLEAAQLVEEGQWP